MKTNEQEMRLETGVVLCKKSPKYRCRPIAFSFEFNSITFV